MLGIILGELPLNLFYKVHMLAIVEELLWGLPCVSYLHICTIT
jgi:hypothetical protein